MSDTSCEPEALCSAKDLSEHPLSHSSFDQFAATIAALRAPDGCPWDREQTHASIASNMIEEAYEAVDAIEMNDVPHLREELGDVLLQVVLQSQIAADAGEFTIDDVCADINEKMIRRHPHVFGEVYVEDSGGVLSMWEQVKLEEKAAADSASLEAGEERSGLLEGVPASFPALMQAQKISRKAAAVGFEWESLGCVWDQVNEEVSELKEAYEAAPKTSRGKVDGGSSAENAQELVSDVELEFGDVLFSLVNVARHMGIDSESALRASCQKFRMRWAHMEQSACDSGLILEDLTVDELEALWVQAKENRQR